MIEHDVGKKRELAIIYRWNDPLHRVEWWCNIYEKWIPNSGHETTVNIPSEYLVNYEDTWTEPCEGITE